MQRGTKNKPLPGTAADARKRDEPPALVAFWLLAVAVVALVLLLALLAWLFVWNGLEDDRKLQQLEVCSRHLVGELSNRTLAWHARLRAFGADPSLRQVFRSGDSAALGAREEALAELVPGAIKVRLIKADTDDVAAQALSYAGLDLVHQAERQRGPTPLEVHRLGHPDAHLAIAGPVLDDEGDTVLGVVHVALPLSMLPSVTDTGGGAGRIAFQQRVGADVALVEPGRSGAVPARSPDYAAEVPATRLRVAAWVTRGGLLDGDLLAYGGGTYLTLVGLLAALLWLPLRALQRALAVDYASLVALVEDAVNRRPLRRGRCRLAETQPVIEVIARLLRHLPSAPAGVPTAPDGVLAERLLLEDGRADARSYLATRALIGIEIEEQPELVEAQGGGRQPPAEVPAEVFRAYDIRGIVGLDLSPDLVRNIGLAIGTEALAVGDQTVIVARDTRPSGVDLSAALTGGLRASGCAVLDLGIVPVPLLYFATRYRGNGSGVMVTGSHNPSEYNGLKVVIGGMTLAGEGVEALRTRILEGRFAAGNGRYQETDLVSTYIAHVEKDVAIARTMRLVVDCGNAAAAVVAPELYRALGCELIELNCDPQAGFPDGRVPDPARPECLAALQARVVAERANLGFAFDGDGDRLGVVDSSGKIIWADRILMLLAADVLSRHPGTDVVFDVKSSRHLATEILRHGGRPVMWKSGHSLLKAKLHETGALLGGEWSGHIAFQERWYGFDDALYAGARLLEVLALDPRPSAAIFAELPEAPVSTPEIFLPMAEGEPARVMAEVLQAAAHLDGWEVNTIDGLRAEFDRGWGLVRASNTRPGLVFRFEADDEAAMERSQALIRHLLEQAAPDLILPF